MIKTIAVSAVLLLLTGCASVFDPNGASSSYTCEEPDKPGSVVDGVTCKTPFAIYKSTHGAPETRQSDLPIGVTMEDYESGKYGSNESDPNAKMPHAAAGMTYHMSGGMVAQGQPEFARPVRTPAQVMRIWIAPWIDKSDDLHFPSYVYTEIQPRRWNFGVESFNAKGLIVPSKELGAVPGARVTPKRANGTQGQHPVSSQPEQPHLDTGAKLQDLPSQ